ncbi:hypothetical protein [Salidesulfovibrio brasiliensis]|uniref:hypothetical protein n=1 Tax=Salidesulfovibrio brasiliensis TaxID=221711 RepID=UPI0006D1193E|nr:hypothetical protein [Salidesulfovibrio brasiliensis]
MKKLIFVLCFFCLLTACRHTVAPDSGTPSAGVELTFDTGVQVSRVEMYASVIKANGEETKPIIMTSFEQRIQAERKGDRVHWKVTLSDLAMFGTPPRKGTFYSTTFDSDIYGQDKKNFRSGHTDYRDRYEVGETIVDSIELPEGRFKVGDKSLLVFSTEPDLDGLEFLLPEPPARNIYRGETNFKGVPAYEFNATVSDITVRPEGRDYDLHATIEVSEMLRKDCRLPLRERSKLAIHDPKINETRVLYTHVTPAETPEAVAEDSTPAKQSIDWAALIEQAAPPTPVTEPIEFKYKPANEFYSAEVVAILEAKNGTTLNDPVMSFTMHVTAKKSGNRMKWSLSYPHMKIGEKDYPQDNPITFDSDMRCGDIKNFQNDNAMSMLRTEDMYADFRLPTGSFKTGDMVFPPIYGHNTNQFEMIYPETVGYTFVGVQHLDGKKVYVMRLDKSDVIIRERKTGQEDKATIWGMRYFDAETMHQVYYEGSMNSEERLGLTRLTVSKLPK